MTEWRVSMRGAAVNARGDIVPRVPDVQEQLRELREEVARTSAALSALEARAEKQQAELNELGTAFIFRDRGTE